MINYVLKPLEQQNCNPYNIWIDPYNILCYRLLIGMYFIRSLFIEDRCRKFRITNYSRPSVHFRFTFKPFGYRYFESWYWNSTYSSNILADMVFVTCSWEPRLGALSTKQDRHQQRLPFEDEQEQKAKLGAELSFVSVGQCSPTAELTYPMGPMSLLGTAHISY